MNLTKPQKLIYDMEKFAGGAIAVICGSMLINGKKDLSELKQAVNEIYRLNDALRIRINETDGEVLQTVTEYTEQDVPVLCFENKTELDAYAENFAKTPMDFYGNLCEVSIVTLPDKCGLLVKLHHIIGDAWTLSLLGTQFNKLINSENVDTYSYTDYVESESAYLTGKRYEKDKAFFFEQFKKCDEVTYLSEKQTDSLNACRKTFVIDKDKTKKINNYAQQKGTSAFMLFMAALSAYMNRTKMNAEKFYIGTAVLNRNSIKEKNTAGMFINTVPMLIELDNTKSFAENLSGIEDTAFSIFRHQKYNYGDVLTDIRKEYGFNEKLYDVMISYQNATITGADIETTWYHSGTQSESLQIHIDDRDNEGVFRIHYDYLTDKFTAEKIEKMHQHISNLLFDAISNDTKHIYELNILSSNEKQKLLYDFNDTSVEYPRDKCVHQLFEKQVEKIPDKIAIIACDKTLTYKELNEQANRIAHSLIEKGVGIGDIVAFMLPRKSYLIAAMLGILKSGAAYMPIDPDYPQDRIDYMLSDSGAKICITDDNISELLNNESANNPCVNMTSEDLCYCIYTSGSTGKPKGTLLTHANVVNYVNNNNNNVVHKIIKDSYRNIVSVTTVGFDIFVTESLLPLANGIEIVLASEEQAKFQSELNLLIKQNPAEVIQTTPTKMKSLIADKQQLDYLKTVKVIILGGEALEKSLVEELGKITEAEIFNIYGPTETTVWSTNAKIKEADITIGKPIANTQIYIVDKYMKPTPIGVTGELCIAGDGVGAGYLNRPELTAEKFIDNPFGEGKLYKTGDLACWRDDGNIVYVGRNDFQVKIRGLRIELGEIENAICSIDGISQAVVVVRKNAEGRQLICAFYTGTEIDAKEIRSHIGKKLPKYMLPHIFTHLDEMPLTSSGKISRKALPEVDLYAVDTAVEYVAPTSEQEKILVGAVQSVLGCDKVGIMDNFFDIGGDSLKAIELISKLEKQGYRTDTKTIFDCDTIKELAQRLTVAETEDEIFDFSGDIPATDAQMRVYTAQSMNSNSTTYNVPYVFKVDEVDIDRLQAAVNKLIDRHEILRTHFENKDGSIIQVIDSNAVCQVEQICLPLTREVDAAKPQTEGETTPQSPSATSPLTSGASIEDVINSFIRPFDLSKAPLLRVGVFENTVMVDMHHIITDGSSMPVFFKELNELYMGRELNNAPVQYKRFAVETQDHTESEKYWLSVYSDELPVLEINTDFKRGQKQTFNGSAIYDTVDIDLHNKILTFCKEQNITPYVFYMGAFNILLSKFSGDEDIVVGMPISGRDAKYIDTIGMFVNTIALRNKPIGTKTVLAFLQEVKETSVHAINHQDYPYGELVKKLNANTTDRNPLFDVMFAYQSEQMTDIVFGDNKAELLPIPVTTSKYDFTFNVMPRADDVVIMAEYCTDLYKENTMQRFVDGYKQILSRLLNGKASLKDISAISKQEQQKLLYDFNDTAVDYPWDKCVHQLFEEQSAITPDKTAVIACDKTMTYRELNEEANRIAHSLIEKGVGNGDIVAFMLSRRSDLIATMLGILKSGAAYMPIDPDYPQDRIEYMLSDSGAKLCITDANISELLNSENASNPCVSMTSENLCYCIYTSGSTGKPKGTLLTHANVVNYVNNNNNNNVVHRIIKDSYKNIVSVTTVGFDIFVTESLLPLVNGMEILLANEEQAKFQSELNLLIKQNPADVIQTTPTKMKSLIADKQQLDYLKTVKVIILGGEALEMSLVEELGKITEAEIFNIYGPTETTVWSTNAEIKSELSVYDCFNNIAECNQKQIALRDKNTELTYGQLNDLVNDYCAKLQALGIKKDDIVAIHLDRSIELVAFQLAVLKAGAMFLPVDKRYPIDRIEHMCKDCSVALLISDEFDSLSNSKVLSLSAFKTIVTNTPATTIKNSGVCYIIYTSGSTGNPKGCMLKGSSIVNFCKNNNTLKTLKQNKSNIFACVNSVSFDYFIAESLLPLLNGYQTVILDDTESTDQKKFLEVVKNKNINVLMTTPTRLKLFFDDKQNCKVLEQLSCICTSGEALPEELLQILYKKAPKAHVYNPLGPSECTVWNVGGELERCKGIDIHIGKPIANTQIYIVDKYMKPAPIGVTGELCIAGDGVGAGYLNRPELTAEKFIDNPFGKGKLYKTGDLAYWREDGNIVYVGRNDFQVKIRGLRIELGEIENAICGINGISQAVVVVRKNTEGRQLICAFYTGTETDAKAIRSEIGNKLPKYMLPHIFTHLDEMPLTSSGKINRKALPKIDLENISNDTEYVAPENEQQKELCKLIESVLDTTPVGITDDFFDLGGDSLKAIEFVSKAHNEGIYFNLQNVFDYPTVKSLCECIENGDKQVISFADVDFTEVNGVLEKNKVEYITEPQKCDVGNILLAGATGFLGIHILADYLNNDTGIAYCLVRGRDKTDSTNRLKELLHFYFGDKYNAMNRIEVICADLQKDKFGLSDEKYTDLLGKVDTVINCAASVKHYGSYKYFYEANVETTKRLIEFCKKANAKLIHTSTISVSGNSFADEFAGSVSETELHFYESSLYIGQPLDNVYARSKFEAEKAVLDAMAKGLKANIMRMGQLTNRYTDGKFQKNYESNAFLKRIHAVLELGVAPDYLIDLYAEFTPIDEAACAVMAIVRHFSSEQTVFHINSTKVVYMDKLLEIFNKLGFKLKAVSGAEFTKTLRQTAKQSGMEYIFETFINDMDENDRLNYDSNIHFENDFTVRYLKALGFEWSDIGIDYLRKYVEYFRRIGYFR